MNKLLVKVCGNRNIQNIREISELKPDLIGFVFYPASPRYAGEMEAGEMMNAVTPGIIKTGVFVDADLFYIKATVLKYGLRCVQLHGNESPEICRRLMSLGLKIIKVFKISDRTDFSEMMPFVNCSTWFLFDTETRIPGGSGESFNWRLLEKYDLGHPFFLSGGIGQGDAERILALHHPALTGVDINSRFEIEPGIKDIERVNRFIRRIRREKEK